MRKLLFVFFFCGVGLMAFAQEKTVTGTITAAEDGITIIGATVNIQGTTMGVTSDLDGKYSIIVSEGDVLVYRFVGMKTQEVTVGSDNVYDVVMEIDNIGLDEVIVTGYGSAIKRELSGSITKVSTEGLADVPTVSFESAIQGKTAGVFIEQASGKLGETVKMRIRGSSSISANNQPLYVIDGVPVTSVNLSNVDNQPTSPLADINMADVESIQILKDASAAAIYGSRASNGVVVITTKSGQAGDTRFNMSYTTGISEPSRMREWLNADQYLELFNEAMDNVSVDGLVWDWLPKEDIWEMFVGDQWDKGWDTDWQKEAFQQGSVNRINLSASGGSEDGSFYAGMSYDNTVGILKNNAMNKFNAKVSLDHKSGD